MWPSLSITNPEPSACCDLARLDVAEGIGLPLALRGRRDLDDAGAAAPVDLADVDRRRAGRGLRRALRDRRRLDDGRRLVERAERPGAAERRAASEKGGGGQRGERLGGGRHPVGTLAGVASGRIGVSGEAHASVIGAA